MLSIAFMDVRRILSSKATWFLLLISLATMGFKTVQFSMDQIGLMPNVSSLDVSGFLPFLTSAAELADGLDIPARDSSPLLRLMLSFRFLDYLALTSIVVFGGFFAQDIDSDYVSMRRCRGLSPRSIFAANAITIAVVSSVLTAIAIVSLFVVCLGVNPRSVNSLTHGQQVLQYVGFLPQEAASTPIAYVALFMVLYTGVLSFLGMLGFFAARISRKVLVASVAPALLILLLGRLAPGLPWLFMAFSYDNLSFANRGIVDLEVAFKYAGTYPLWFGALLLIGVLDPDLFATIRKARAWLNR